MEVEHPRDVDPSITGQPHQVTGKDPDLMGEHTRTLGNWADMPAAVPKGTAATRFGEPGARQAAPRCSASQTAVDSRTPSSTDRPQCAIQAAMPSGVPERYPSNAAA